MDNTIIFLFLFVLMLSIMLIIKINILLDLFNNELFIIIKLFGIKIIKIKILLLGFSYSINNGKLKPIKISLNKEQIYLMNQIKTSIINKLYFDDIYLKSSIGIVGACETSIIVSVLDLMCRYYSKNFEISKDDTRLYYINQANFTEKELMIDMDMKVYFTIFDLVFAIILSFYKRGKYVKKRKQKRNR